MGNGAAVSYITLQMQDESRRFVVSVAPNSMKPKDEVTEQNLAIELAQAGWLDPLTLFERLDDSDPQDTAEKVTMFRINPQQYFMTYFPESAQQQPPQLGAPAPSGGQAPPQPSEAPTTLSAPASSADISKAKPPSGQMPK